jgi:hypothetical protein
MMKTLPEETVSDIDRLEGINSDEAKNVRLKWIGKPDSVMTLKKSHSDHSSCPRIAPGVERPYPRARVDHPTLLFGLAPGGVCQASIITDEPVSSYLAFSTLPAEMTGGIFSVVLSPDHSEPPLTATLSCGVRTFLSSHCEKS